jgi:hypothetical protein
MHLMEHRTLYPDRNAIMYGGRARSTASKQSAKHPGSACAS